MIDRLSFTVLTLVLAFFATAESALTQSIPTTGSQSANTSGMAVSSEADAVTEKTAVVPVIGAGDLLKVGVLGAPESDSEVRGGADGNVALNFIGSVHVAGLTPEQAQATVTHKLVAGVFFTQP